MTDIAWIKLDLDIFSDNRKIKYLRKKDDGNEIVLIWIMLLVLAGRCNNKGKIGITDEIPYTLELLADELGFEEPFVVQAITYFEELRMVYWDEEEFLTIASWEDHQNTEAMEKAKNSKTNAQRRWRAKKKNADTDDVDISVDGSVDISVDADVDDKKTSTVDAENISVDDADIRKKNKNKKENKKYKYGSFSNVLLTEDEFIRLGKDYGEELRDETIEWFSSYIAEKGYTSKEHNLSIRRWVINAVQKERSKNGFKNSVGNGKESTEDRTDFDRNFYRPQVTDEEFERAMELYEQEGI